MQSLVSDFDLTNKEISDILYLAGKVKNNRNKFAEVLKGKVVGMIFEKHSTRTKASFESAIYQLGGNSIFLDSFTSQMGRGETVVETGVILSKYCDAILARLYSQKSLEEIAKSVPIPVVNALTDEFHPCQILADLLTIKEKKGKLEDLKLVYIGDGANNVSNSLLISCSKMEVNTVICCPENSKYSPSPDLLSKVEGNYSVVNDPLEAIENADIVYTDTWVSMGMESEKEERKKDLQKYQINSELLANAKEDCIVMHCLPAYKGLEITEEVLNGSKSVVLQQAENRLYAQKALLIKLLAGE